jgi:hypothetical protein
VVDDSRSVLPQDAAVTTRVELELRDPHWLDERPAEQVYVAVAVDVVEELAVADQGLLLDAGDLPDHLLRWQAGATEEQR